MLDQSVVHMFLFTVQGCVHPISGMGAVVGDHAALGLARGCHASLGRGGSVPRGSGAPVPMLQGSGEAENAPNGLQGSGTLMTSWGSGEAEGVPKSRAI
jgi:hypothetical protein